MNKRLWVQVPAGVQEIFLPQGQLVGSPGGSLSSVASLYLFCA